MKLTRETPAYAVLLCILKCISFVVVKSSATNVPCDFALLVMASR